jgi:hypothetical protein
MSLELRHGWSPPWALHVHGAYSDREQLEGELPEQRWGAACTKCGAAIGPLPCTSGAVRQRISWWAADHAACVARGAVKGA